MYSYLCLHIPNTLSILTSAYMQTYVRKCIYCVLFNINFLLSTSVQLAFSLPSTQAANCLSSSLKIIAKNICKTSQDNFIIFSDVFAHCIWWDPLKLNSISFSLPQKLFLLCIEHVRLDWLNLDHFFFNIKNASINGDKIKCRKISYFLLIQLYSIPTNSLLVIL